MTGVRFVLDGAVHDTGPIDPTMTLLEVLRERLRRTGTKEGCAEGDCGACTVLGGEGAGGRVAWRALNACIVFAPMIDGRAVMTVESLRGDDPIQRAMVAAHASQCGFCTPGFVMAIKAKAMAATGTTGLPPSDLIAGNLCRCTGYGALLEVAKATAVEPKDDAALAAQLTGLRRGDDLALEWFDPLAGHTRRWFAPRTVDRLAALLLDHPDAQVVAGATDVALWVTKQRRMLPVLVSLAEVPELAHIEEMPGGLCLGAGVHLVDAAAALAALSPELGELVRRFGAMQVRSAATIGGNLANASPIGDLAPALIALGATLVLRRGDAQRRLPLEAFFVAYGKQDRRPGEFVVAVEVPRPSADALFRVTKLSKRFDSDVSAVCGAFALQIAGGRITTARVAFGGMAGTPARAPACEAALTGADWSHATVAAAARAIAADYAPLSDVRGSAAYRSAAAASLVTALWSEPGDVTLRTLAAIDG